MVKKRGIMEGAIKKGNIILAMLKEFVFVIAFPNDHHRRRQKYEMVTESIDSSLAALIHPNSTTMRRCFQ